MSRLASLLLVGALAVVAGTAGMAAGGRTPAPTPADRVASDARRIGAGTRVKIQLVDGTTLRGVLVAVGERDFDVLVAEGRTERPAAPRLRRRGTNQEGRPPHRPLDRARRHHRPAGADRGLRGRPVSQARHGARPITRPAPAPRTASTGRRSRRARRRHAHWIAPSPSASATSGLIASAPSRKPR